jgi:hypothetical protein
LLARGRLVVLLPPGRVRVSNYSTQSAQLPGFAGLRQTL